MIDTMAEKGKYSILTDAVMRIRSNITYGPRLSDCWLHASTRVEALRKMNLIDASIAIDVRKFNTAMSKSILFGEVMHRFDGSNATGVFRITFQNKFFYYFTQESKQASYPVPLNSAWKDKIMEAAANVLVIPNTRARPADMSLAFVDMTGTNNNDTGGTTYEDEEPSPQKRPRLETVETLDTSYWPNSPEARQVFHPNTLSKSRRITTTTSSAAENDESFTSCNETAKEAVERRILLLKSVHGSEDGWRNVIAGRDANNYCTKLEIFEIRQRSTFLCCAYQIALLEMNGKTWHDCCKQACKLLNDLGMTQATFFKTIANWNKVFRRFECFPHPNPYVQCGKRPLPPLLEIFPNAKDQIISFGIKNLATLSIESVHDLIVTKVIPRLATTWQSEAKTTTSRSTSTNNESSEPVVIDTAIRLFLNAHKLKSMSLTTTWRWMRLLGFQYDSRKKSFYVDGHERADVVLSRQTFCKRYLTDYEPYCNRWIQLTIEEAKTINNLNLDFGYSYFHIITNEERIEFHVDYLNRMIREHQQHKEQTRSIDTIAAKAPTTSIRVSARARPIMIVGQDESVFAQYLLGSKTWVGPRGQRPLLPKSEGDGYMLSAFVSREFGFGRELSADELVRVNTARRGIDKTYIDIQAAMEILKSTHKPILTESPL